MLSQLRFHIKNSGMAKKTAQTTICITAPGNEEIKQVSEILRSAMQNTIELKVPLTIDINYGKNWAEAK